MGDPFKTLSFTLKKRYKTQRKDFDSKMPDRRLHVRSAQVTSLRLNQIALQPKFDLNSAPCIYTSICSVMIYYSGGDLRYE